MEGPKKLLPWGSTTPILQLPKLIYMLNKLEIADLEGHGFQKEEIRAMVSTGKASNYSAYTTTLYYYKAVHCSQVQVMKVVLEIEKLLPG